MSKYPPVVCIYRLHERKLLFGNSIQTVARVGLALNRRREIGSKLSNPRGKRMCSSAVCLLAKRLLTKTFSLYLFIAVIIADIVLTPQRS